MCSHLLVESANQDGTVHRQIRTKCRILQLHIQDLVLDELFPTISCYGSTHYRVPTVYQSFLQQRGFQPLHSQKLWQQLTYRTNFLSKHNKIY